MSVVRIRVFHTVRRKLSTAFVSSKIPPSPVPHLLSSNATPTEDERKLIRDAIAGAEAQMFQLMQDRLVNKKKLELFDEFLEAHRALLIPIRNLPTELLQDIFLFYAETPTGYHRWIRPPFVLGQVCRAWRQAAVALPGLWNKLPAFKLTSPRTKDRSYTSFLEELLRRSGNSPTLRVFIRAPFKDVAQNHPVITTLAPHAKRIQTLTIESSVATVKLFSGMANDLVNLEQLDLSFWAYKTFGTDEQRGWVDEFQSAPKLKKVSIMGKCPPHITLPWSNIQEYRERYDGGPALQLFERSRGSLTTLEIVKVRHQVPMIPPTTLEGLKTLKVKLEHPSDVAARFLTNMTLPAIESVHVSYGGIVVPILATMLSHSSHTRSLRSLAFRGTSIHSATELKSLFSVVPQLRELDIEVTDGDSTFLNLFVNAYTRPLILPLLEKLSIYTVSTTGMEEILNSIAHVRCERTESDAMPSLLADPTQMDFDLIQEVRPLQTLRVNLISRESRLESQAALNGWKAPTRTKQFCDTAKLQMWRKEIIRSFPSYFGDPEPGLCLGDPRMVEVLKKGKIPQFPENWDGILGEIEAFDVHHLDAVSLRVSVCISVLQD